jgi:hypothetical protein
VTDKALTKHRAYLRRAQGIPGFVPSPTVAAHLRALRAAGWTVRQIGEWSQVSEGTLYRILGDARRSVHLRTATRLAALAPDRVPPRMR